MPAAWCQMRFAIFVFSVLRNSVRIVNYREEQCVVIKFLVAEGSKIY